MNHLHTKAANADKIAAALAAVAALKATARVGPVTKELLRIRIESAAALASEAEAALDELRDQTGIE